MKGNINSTWEEYDQRPREKKQHAFDISSSVFPLEGHEVARLQAMVNKRAGYERVKRVFDCLLSIAFLIPGLPLMLGIALWVRVTSPGPIIFTQTRIGKQGRPFQIYKFRTMYEDANVYDLSPSHDDQDKRITRCGAKLRRTGLDELPQLFNIFKGDMSLVGPRPEMPFLIEQYKDVLSFRHVVKPGLTGVWQLCPYSSDQIYEHPEYDYYYILNQSFVFDCKIIFMTMRRTFYMVMKCLFKVE